MVIGANLGSFRALVRAQARGRLAEGWLWEEASALLGLGLSHIELLTDGICAFPSAFDERAIGRLAALRGRATFSVHLPYIFVDLSSPNDVVRRASVNVVCQAIRMTEPLAPGAYVVHLSSPRGDYVAPPHAPRWEREWTYRLLRDKAAKSVEELLLHIPAERLCVENLVEALPFELTATLVEEFGLSLCFDVDHHVAQGGDFRTFLETFFPRIREIHIHTQACRPYFKGSRGPVDVPGFLACLRANGYAGALVIEGGGQRRAIAEALAVLRRFWEE